MPSCDWRKREMTNEQKTVVDTLRSQGLGYKRIAVQTGISANTVKSYLRRCTPISTGQTASFIATKPMEKPFTDSDYYCRYCGKPVVQNPGRKEKKFCSDTCRTIWWNSHLDLVKRKAIYNFICPTCGREFSAYGNAHRKYCSHSCYIEYRFGGAK